MNKIFNKIINSEFIIKNEFKLDEIIRVYGKTGDEIEAHINQTETNLIKIVRKYTMVENSAIDIVSEQEYSKNFQSDKSYFKNEYGDSTDYLKNNYEEYEISKEDYENEIENKLTGNYIFTTLNYSDFINDFDFYNFDLFFNQVLIEKYSREYLESIQEFVLSQNKTKGKILLQICFSNLSISNKFLEDFKISDESNEIQKKICDYFLYYNYIIKISLVNYYQLIFPKLINYFSINEFSKANRILKDLLDACYKMQQNKIFQDDKDENKRTKHILDLLDSKNNYRTESQYQTGKSSTGKKIGSCDGLIIDKKFKNEYYVEALNLSSFDKTYLKSHINKLEFNYDYKGLPIKFILVYCNLKENTFDDFINKYKNFIESEITFLYQKSIVKEEAVEFNKYTDSRIFQSSHMRENKSVSLYHILLKFS